MYGLHWHWLYVSTTWPWPFSNHLLNITQFLTTKKLNHPLSRWQDTMMRWCLVWIVESRPRFGSSFPAECHGRNLMVKLEWRLGRNMVWCWWPRHIHDTGDSVCQCQINNQQINSTSSGASVNSWFKHGWTIDGFGHWFYQLKSK